MGIDIFTLNKAKRYTNLVALGLASATVDDVNKSITFTLASDGSQHTIHFNQPSDGQDGISVTGISDKGNGIFTLLFSDGSESDPIQCVKGEDGFSPTATVEKVGKVATITITDKNGTTTATIKDGEGSEGGEANTIESISVNGVNVPVDSNKNVDITVPSIEGLTKDADLAAVAKSGDYEDLSNKPIIPSLDGYAKTSEIPSKVSELENDSNYLSSIPAEYVTDTELNAKGYLTEHLDISGKVDKVEGKSLVSDAEIARLASVDNYDDTDIKAEIAKKADTTAIPSKVSELTNDSNYQTAEQVNSTVTTEIAKVVADAPEDLNTLKEMSDWIAGHEDDASAMNSAISDNKTAITALQTGKADKSEIPTELPANGGNSATVNGHTVGIDVPSDAKFTDTTYSDATQIEHGLMSVDDKKKLDGLTKYTPDGSTITADEDGTLHGQSVDIATTEKTGIVKPDGDTIEVSADATISVSSKALTFSDHDTATSGTSFTDAEDGNMLVTDCTKNLLNPTLETTTQNGVTCTNNGDGTYTLNGTASTNTYFTLEIISNFEDNIYKIVSLKNANSNLYSYINAQTPDGAIDYSILIDSLKPTGYISKNKYKSFDMGIAVLSGTTLTNEIVKPMLTTDLNATYDDFVPYGGYDIKTCGKNLVDVNTFPSSQVLNGITFTTDKKAGTITLNGTATKDFNNHLFNFIVVDGIKEYSFGGWDNSKIKVIHDNLGLFTDDEFNFDGLRNITNINANKKHAINCVYRQGQVFDNFVIKPYVSANYNTYVGYDNIEPYQDGGTVHIDSTTEFPLLGLKSFNGETNIISPANVKCVYPTNESGKGVLDSLYNKDKMLTEQNKSLEVLGKCKNLLNPTLETDTQNGVTCTNNGDGTYTLNGTATKDTYFVFENITKFEDGKYKIVGSKNQDIYANALRRLDGVMEYSKLQERYFPTAYLSNDVYKLIQIGIVVLSGTTLTNEIVKPMFTTDLNATYDDFVPYTGDGETLASDVAEIKNDLGGLSFSASGTTLTITDGTHTWTLETNS